MPSTWEKPLATSCWTVLVGGRVTDVTAKKQSDLIEKQARYSTITVDTCKRLDTQVQLFYSPVDTCKRLKALKASTGKLQVQQSCDYHHMTKTPSALQVPIYLHTLSLCNTTLSQLTDWSTSNTSWALRWPSDFWLNTQQFLIAFLPWGRSMIS